MENFLVNGGVQTRHPMKTTELVSTEGTTLVHDIPTPGMGHCNIKINESTILIAGLNWRAKYSETYFQNILTGDYVQGPVLDPPLMGRPWQKASCGLVNFGNKPHAIIVSGIHKIVYALDLNDWTRGWKINTYSRFSFYLK